MKKSTQSIIMVICLVLSLLQVQTFGSVANAASKPKLAKTSVTLDGPGDYKSVKIKNVTKKQVKKLVVSTDDDNKVSVFKSGNKTSFKVAANASGKTKVRVKLYLKKAIKGKKTYKFTLTVKVKKDSDAPDKTPKSSEEPSESP